MNDRRPKILIVEDESIVADDLRSRLQTKYSVIGVVPTAREAIALVKQNLPDVILMDVRLKGDMNGVQCAILIQSESRKPVPVVFLSALSPDDLAMLGAVERYTYIRKPVSDDDLNLAIQKVMRKSWYSVEEPA